MHQTIRRVALRRHVHLTPYAALVLSGGYEEAGDNGRFQVSAGNVIFHDHFEAHLNRFQTEGATVLNLPLLCGNCRLSGMARVANPDLVVVMAERCGRTAADLLVSLAERCEFRFADWPDVLAARLIDDTSVMLSEWGEQHGLTPWTVSRGFAQVFGISPEVFRARARSRQALGAIRDTQSSLATIAAEFGFADQAHMTRSIRQLTGSSPSAWRSRANGFNTEGHRVVYRH